MKGMSLAADCRRRNPLGIVWRTIPSDRPRVDPGKTPDCRPAPKAYGTAGQAGLGTGP